MSVIHIGTIGRLIESISRRLGVILTLLIWLVWIESFMSLALMIRRVIRFPIAIVLLTIRVAIMMVFDIPASMLMLLMLHLHSLQSLSLLFIFSLFGKQLHLQLQFLIPKFQLSFMLLHLFFQPRLFFIFLRPPFQMIPVGLIKCLLLLFYVFSSTFGLVFCLLCHGLGLSPSLFGLEFVIARSIVAVSEIDGSQFGWVGGCYGLYEEISMIQCCSCRDAFFGIQFQ
jgi:hypothetical protein